MTRIMNRMRGSLRAATTVAVAIIGFSVFVTLGRAAPPVGQYTVNSDGTVIDNATGLMWERGSSTHLSGSAAAYCSDLSLGGHNDWRLPEVLELRSLVDEHRNAPSIDVATFPETPNALFCSGTPVNGGSSDLWAVHFENGDVMPVKEGVSFPVILVSCSVRCVR